jgi:hypothetical protein
MNFSGQEVVNVDIIICFAEQWCRNSPKILLSKPSDLMLFIENGPVESIHWGRGIIGAEI